MLFIIFILVVLYAIYQHIEDVKFRRDLYGPDGDM